MREKKRFKGLRRNCASLPFLRSDFIPMMMAGSLIIQIIRILRFSLLMPFWLIMRIIRSYVRPSQNVRLCTAGPRSTNFCKHMHVDEMPATFHRNRQRP